MPDSLVQTQDDYKSKSDDIQIKVENHENDTIFIWSVKKFTDKLETIKDMINTYQDGYSQADLDQLEDPFMD